MCNLYSVTTSQEAIRALARALGEYRDLAGNLAPLPAVFPDQMALWCAPPRMARGSWS